jgi:hypothetical protein
MLTRMLERMDVICKVESQGLSTGGCMGTSKWKKSFVTRLSTML